MDWWLVLLIMFGGVIVLILTAMPVAFSFMVMVLIGAYLFSKAEVD